MGNLILGVGRSGKVCPASGPPAHGQSRMNEASVEERVVVQLQENSEL